MYSSLFSKPHRFFDIMSECFKAYETLKELWYLVPFSSFDGYYWYVYWCLESILFFLSLTIPYTLHDVIRFLNLL